MSGFDEHEEKWRSCLEMGEYRAQPPAEPGTGPRTERPSRTPSPPTPGRTLETLLCTVYPGPWRHRSGGAPMRIFFSKCLAAFRLLRGPRVGRAEGMHWSTPFYTGDVSAFGSWYPGRPGTNPSWTPGGNSSFWGVRLHAGFRLQGGAGESAPLTPVSFKGQCPQEYLLQLWPKQ